MHAPEAVRFSVLDLATVKAGGSIAQTFRETLDLAQHAEAWGYTRFWLAEHHNMTGVASAATSVLIGHVAAGTKHLRVGSGGVMLPNHPPLVIAEQFGTLETLFPNRIDLGLGRAPGTDTATLRALRRQPDSAADFPNQVQELLMLLGPAAPGQVVKAVPGANTNVPVWLLGSSTYSAQLAAHLGLPFAFAAHFAPQELRRALSLYRAGFQASEYLQEPYALVCLPVVAGETDAEAKLLTTTLQMKFRDIVRGVKDSLLAEPVESLSGKWTEQEQFFASGMLAELIAGGPDTVERELRSFIESTHVNEVMISSTIFDHAKRLRSYEIVAQAMRKISAAAMPEPLAAGV